ncbi:hypothetical protein [Haladaptatus sp. DFWS20]|uniref:hypothetical protein n=1 Tax=Haladaptatus sp. DFWS20 TaxID=3403467 RepID=UPI003EBE1B81
MKTTTESAGEAPSDDSRDESHDESMNRWHRVGELLKLWGNAIEVWLKIVAALLAGLAMLLKSTPLN